MILHIVAESEWEHAKSIGEYKHPSLEREGFIHFSKPDQVVRVANFNFKGQTGLILLLVDEKRLKAKIEYEGESPTDLFPHLYGALNLDAVVGTVAFPVKTDGSFSLPELT
jgi:uncharacterized protein (DUF952 family)